MLFCQGSSQNSIVRYNISQNDRYVLFTNSGGTAEVCHNIFYIGKGLKTNVHWGNPGGKMKIHNNIFYNEGEVRNPNWGNYEYRNNAYHGFETTPDDPGKILGDPQLTAPGTGGTGIITTFQSTRDQLSKLDGYKLRPDSPCIDRGLPADGKPPVPHDFWNNRISDRKPDVGAHQSPKQN